MPQLRPRLPVLAAGGLLLIFFPHPSAPLAAPALALTQAGSPRPFRSTVDTVEVHATVRGVDGQFVSGLTKDDFELLDNGQRREISVFAGEVQPIAAALVLDRSGSVAQEADQIATSAAAFVDGLLPADQASIDTLTLECQPLTANKAQLRNILRGRMQGDSGSPVWAGVDNAISSLREISGRRAILLFSDGDDYGPNPLEAGIPVVTGQPCHRWADPSEASLADTARRAGREGIMVYTVSVEGPAVQTHDADLRAIARATGGDRYRLRDQGELSTAFGRIVDELHHQYLLGFVPEVLDGKVHTLTVRVKRSGANVRARENYLAVDALPSAPADTGTALMPLTDTEVDQAIRDGSNGQKAQAVCKAVGTFRDRPEENQAYVDVLLEGPMGRIMHAARDARLRHETLAAADLPPGMRAPTLSMTADLKTSLTVPGTAGLSVIVALRLRGAILTERMLRPLSASLPATAGAVPGQHYHRTEEFDLAAFRAVPGPDVEVIVRSVSGPRSCVIGEKDRAAIR